MKLPHLRSEQIKTQPDQTSALINKIIDRVNDPNLGGGGGGGTSDFDQLTNRPSYAGTTMTGSTNIPAVPTKTSQLNNDSGFVNTTDLTTAISNHNTSGTAHSDIRNAITNIQNVIPTAATVNNKLTDKNYVDDSINSVTAYYITKNAAGDAFATKAELNSTTTFYSGGQVRIPTRNDYCIVEADESKRDPITGEDPTTRYIYNNGWEFQYIVNKTALTADQLAALNSGVTAADVTKLSGIQAGAEVNVQSDWTEADNTSDAYIKNKPTIGDATLTIRRNGTTAQTFTANSTTNKLVDIQAPVRVDLRGQCQKNSYARSVIALCTVTTTNNTSMNSFSSGRLSFHRDNGAAVDRFIDFIIGNQYASAYKYYFSYSANIKRLNETADLDTSTGFRPCVFKYNNVWYAGIEYHSGNAVQQYVSYYGEKVGIDIFGLDYYKCSYTSGGTTYPSEILNQEVYDSLDYTKTDWTSSLLQTNSLATDNGIISSSQGTNGAYTATLPAKNGTLAMTSDIGNATITIQKNSTTVGSFTTNATSNKNINIAVPTKTSDLTNDGEDGTSTYIETDDAQILSAGQGTVIPDFTNMTPVETFTWSVSDSTYRPIYQMENTGWTYDNMDIDIAYRITVTGTGINQICDVHERWHSMTNYPITSMLNRTLSSTAATTGFRYLRAVYPTSGYVNNNNYKYGTEINCYNSTARTVKVEVFKTNSKVIWNTTKPAGSIYTNSTCHNSSSITAYTVRGWIFRKPADFTATNADSASRISSYEGSTVGSSALLAGEALTNHYMVFLADDGKIYHISNSTPNMVCDGSGKIGILSGSSYNSGAAVSYAYFRPLQLLSATETTNTPHDAVATGDRLYLRCTMDGNGKIHSDNYLAKTMSAGYTWMPIGNATSSTQIYIDARRPTFYTLDADGNLSHINGKEIAASGIADGSISGSKFQLLTDVAVATDTPAGWVSELGGDGVYHIEYSTAGKFANQPTTYGMLEVIIWGNEVDQIWHEHADGDMYKRSGNAYGWSSDPNNTGAFAQLVSREIKSLNAVSDAGWSADQYKIPDISMLSYWNGAYSGTNSNLTYFASNSVTTTNIQDGAITSVKLNDFNTANTVDTWVPVASNSKLQHRVIKPFNADGSVPASAVASDVAKTADTCYQAGTIDLGHRVLVGQTGGSNDHAYWTLPVNKSMDLVNISSITIDNDQNMHFGYSVPGGVSIRPVPGTIANISKQNGFITFETQLTASPGQYQMVMAQFGAVNVTFTSI